MIRPTLCALLALVLSSCALFTAPTAAPAVEAANKLADVYANQTAAFYGIITAPGVSMPTTTRDAIIAGIETNNTQFRDLYQSLVQLLSELGSFDVEAAGKVVDAILERLESFR